MITLSQKFHEDASTREQAHHYHQNARLIFATYHGDLLTALDALSLGADPNVRDADGIPILITALSLHDPTHNNLEFLITELLHAGAHPHAADDTPTSPTPLAYAVELEDTYILRSLLKAGADANAQDSDGDTPLMLAAALDNAEAIRHLLAAGADATLRNHAGLTALNIALEHNHFDCEQLLENHIFAAYSNTPQLKPSPPSSRPPRA